MNCRPTRRHTLRYAIAMLVALPSAHAAEIEEIVVSDQRRAYRGDFSNLETPQAIQTIDSLIMDQAGVRDLNEALDLSASVARQNNFGGLWNSFAVRGFAGDENLPSNYLVNGFNAGRGLAAPVTFPASRPWKCSRARPPRCSAVASPVVR
jgi:outer membrane receptor protein involved in Fe transport